MKKITSLLLTLFLVKAVSGLQYQPTQTDTLITVAAVLVSSGVGAGISLSTLKSTLDELNNEDNTQEVIKYMKNNHDMLVRDISIGKGPLIEQWGGELHLSQQEIEELEERLSGSGEQLLLLKALNGEISSGDALVFSSSLKQIFTDIMGAQRLKNVVQEALGSH